MKNKNTKKCKFELYFNRLGNPIFICSTHSDPKSEEKRVSEVIRLRKPCLKILKKKIIKVLRI